MISLVLAVILIFLKPYQILTTILALFIAQCVTTITVVDTTTVCGCFIMSALMYSYIK